MGLGNTCLALTAASVALFSSAAVPSEKGMVLLCNGLTGRTHPLLKKTDQYGARFAPWVWELDPKWHVRSSLSSERVEDGGTLSKKVSLGATIDDVDHVQPAARPQLMIKRSYTYLKTTVP